MEKKEKKAAKRLTVFTPTYNRAGTLHRTYESLCMQQSQNFIWSIVDDGSTDNTHELVKKWQEAGLIDISYVQQPNGGKMRAFNHGVQLCQTELFMCLDSDDWLTSPTSITNLLNFWDQQKDISQRTDICGMISFKRIIGRVGTYKVTGPTMIMDDLVENSTECENTTTFKTEVLRKYPFPVIEGEKFITEGVVYDRIDQHYQYLIFPEYTQTCEYQDDGYTCKGVNLVINSPRGYQLYYNQRMVVAKKGFIYNAKMYVATSLLAGDLFFLQKANRKFLCLLAIPLGYIQYRRLKHGHY